MAWCCCCKPEDEAIKLWKNNTKYVINLVKKIQNLGKKCILNRQVNREDSIDVRKIVSYFTSVDVGIHNIKLQAVQFLAPNLELLKSRNCQITNAKKRLEALDKEVQMLKENYLKSNVAGEDINEPCSSNTNYNKFQEDKELIQNIPKVQLFAKDAFLKQDRLLSDLKFLLEKYNENVSILKDEIDGEQREVQNTENDHDNSEYESEEEVQVYKNKKAVQYSVKSRRRYSQEYIDDNDSQIHSSNETLTFFSSEFVEQSWPIFRDCIGCFWSNYCVSSEQQNQSETYSRKKNISRNVQRETEGDVNPNKLKGRSRSTKSRHKSKNANNETTLNQSNTRDETKKKNKKREKSGSSVKPKQLIENDKGGKLKVRKKKERGNKNDGAKKFNNVKKTKRRNETEKS